MEQTEQKFISLDDVLGMNDADLSVLKTDEYPTEKLGLLPFTAIDLQEFKQIKKDSMVRVSKKEIKLDEDVMVLKLIITAVAKDKRSDFTFANAALLQKLGVTTADQAVGKMLSPGEIYGLGAAIQELSGFGEQAEQETEEAVKN